MQIVIDIDEYTYRKAKNENDYMSIEDRYGTIKGEVYEAIAKGTVLPKGHGMAIEALAEPKWIPVSKRLPNKNIQCLVTTGTLSFVRIAVYSDLMETIDHKIFWQGEYGRDSFRDITQWVTAWMPLPEPYKGSD